MPKPTEIPAHNETDTGEPKSFSLPVEIDGLNYFFEGEISSETGHFEWNIRVPNWQEQIAKIEEDIKAGGVSAALRAILGTLKRKKGSVGEIDIHLTRDHIQLAHIGTSTWAMPAELGYQNARGVGGFLLENFLTLADIKGLPAFLIYYPDGSSPLSDKETTEWYQRHGFQWIHDVPDEKKLPKNYGDMVRLPRQADLSQPIAKIAK